MNQFYLPSKVTNKKQLTYLCGMINDEQFDKFREQLNKEKDWPMVYMFKFIIPADHVPAGIDIKIVLESAIGNTGTGTATPGGSGLITVLPPHGLTI